PRILQHAIRYSIEAVACRDRGIRRGAEFARGDRSAGLYLHCDLRPELGGDEAVPINSRCSRENAVIAALQTLRLDQALPAACRTAVPIRIFRTFAIERPDQLFRLNRQLLQRTESEVFDQWGVRRSISA